MTARRARTRVGATAALLLLVAAGCSDDGAPVADDPGGSPSASPSDSPSATSSASPTDDPSPSAGQAGIDHPTGADDVLLRIDVAGGFVPVELAFATQPSLLLTGDGRLVVPPDGGPTSSMVPMEVAQLGEGRVQRLLALAADAGLLGVPPDYTDDDGPQVADAATTTVSLTAGGGTWVHEAYALGFGDAAGPRQVLSDFVDAALAATADIATQPFEPAQVALLAQPTDLGRDVRPWPVDEVDLARVARTGCSAHPAAGVVETLVDAGPSTSFRQGDALYSVAGRQVLPGVGAPCPD